MEYKKHDLIMYLENHSSYVLSIAVPLVVAAAMGGYCLFARQDPVLLVVLLVLGTGFFTNGVVEAVPLMMMDRAYPGSLRAGQRECPPVKAATEHSLRQMVIGAAFMVVAAAVALWMEFPYL